jgi:hypothetical protein
VQRDRVAVMSHLIERVERLTNSRNGNPTWRLHLTSPILAGSEREHTHSVTTAPDLGESYALSSLDEGKRITDLVFDKRGRLIDWRILG